MSLRISGRPFVKPIVKTKTVSALPFFFLKRKIEVRKAKVVLETV
jgi:hypothetical protein